MYYRELDQNLNNHIKGFDSVANPAAYIPNFISRFSDEDSNYNSGFGIPNFAGMAENSAFAGGFVGPSIKRQYAGINPQNPV